VEYRSLIVVQVIVFDTYVLFLSAWSGFFFCISHLAAIYSEVEWLAPAVARKKNLFGLVRQLPGTCGTMLYSIEYFFFVIFCQAMSSKICPVKCDRTLYVLELAAWT